MSTYREPWIQSPEDIEGKLTKNRRERSVPTVDNAANDIIYINFNVTLGLNIKCEIIKMKHGTFLDLVLGK
jgi:hypothetical protein